MHAGFGGNKYAVSVLQTRAIVIMIISGELNIDNPTGFAAGGFSVAGTAPKAGKVA